MLTINYISDSTQNLCPDGLVDDFVTKICRGFLLSWCIDSAFTQEIIICQETLVDQFRLAVLRKLISHELIQFRYEDNLILIDKHARLDYWPKGFADIKDRQYDEILDQWNENE